MRAALDRPARAALLGLAVIAVGAAALFIPFLTEEREVFDSTPNPPPLFVLTEIGVAPGSDLCTSGVPLGPRSEVVRWHPTTTFDRAGPPIDVQIRAPGYVVDRELPAIPAGTTLDITIDPPRRPTTATVCLHVNGDLPANFKATAEPRTQSTTVTTLNREPVEADVTLQLLEGRPQSLAARVDQLALHATTFRPGLAGPGLVWIVGLLVVLGVPAAVVWAVWRGAGDDEARGRRAQP